MTTLYGRNLKVILTDQEGKGYDFGELKVKFEIERHAGSSLNTAHVTIFNLLPSTIAKLNRGDQNLEIMAGYVQRFGRIFQGQVRNVIPTIEGTDRIVELFAADGAVDYQNSMVNASFPAGSSLRQVVQAIAGNFSQTVVPPITSIDDVALTGPQHFSGRARDVLDTLAASHGFEWSIQSGKLEVVRSGAANGRTPIEISRESGMVGSPTSRLDQVEVKTLLHPGIVPNGTVRITTAGSVVQADTNALAVQDLSQTLVGLRGGDFRVLRVTHEGDTRGQEWYSTAVADPFKKKSS